MRIIAGEAGGRRLVAPDTRDTRPVTDRVREAVFSIIGAWVEGANVLDLYAGSGSFGLESLSRGADQATFVENGRKALQALTQNIETIGLGGDVIKSTVQGYLKRSESRFDLVFMDPPWALSSDDMSSELDDLDRLLDPNAEVVVSRRHTDDPPEIPKNWRVATDKRYGDTRIFRYKKETEDG
jgi:16S rRNA (guanine966-N2)-methyltransferase